jgi:hypothetical protein
MNIQPIVEGHGEVPAVPELLRRLRNTAEAYGMDVNPAIRKKRSDLVEESQVRKAVRLAMMQEECGAILILFDSDDDAPCEVGPRVQAWAQEEAQTEAGQIPCEVVLAHREYEAWFLAAIESLRGVRGIRPDATSHPDPEGPRGAKGQLEQRMTARKSYSETADQPALTAKFDMAQTYRRCRSFRRMVRAFGLLVTGMGMPLHNWPPPAWEENPNNGPVVQGDNPPQGGPGGEVVQPG